MNQEQRIGAVLVVGGGIGGIQAALNLAESGYKVYLVERSPAIGGVMAQLDKTFPTNDCSMCILSPKLVECGRHLNIEIMACSEILDIQGDAGNFEVLVTKHPRYVDVQKCTGCGECAEVCPVEIPSEFDQGLIPRKAIYRPFAQAFPSAFAIDKRGHPPCNLACPAGLNVQGYIALIGQRKYQEALALIKQSLPLPGVLGRICPHPCEAKCNRGELDKPVSIAALKRFVADQARDEEPLTEVRTKDEKVAIVGSGPAGLTAAYFLAKAGYQVTIFEALPVAGGMLYVGIPAYRLPRKILEQEIEEIKRLGVEIKTNTPIGKNLTINTLFQQGYKAVFIAPGAHKSQKLGIPGEDSEGVVHGVTLLREINLGNEVRVGEKAAIIGGGNVAIDAARSILRLGGKDISILYRRTRAEMPASDEEIEAAEGEGIKISYLVTPTEILVQNGEVAGIRCIRMELGAPDASGRRRPVPIEGSDFEIDVDMVIPAIGQVSDLSFLAEDSGIQTDEYGALIIDPLSLATTREGVFAGGDVQTGPATAIEAVAAGKRAAISIDRYLRGEDIKEGRVVEEEKPVSLSEVPVTKELRPRQEPPTLSLEERLSSFDEVKLAFSEEEAVQEADRCLSCGVCSECMQCVAACRAEAVDHEMTQQLARIEVGSVILCPGFDRFDPSPISNYGYGKYPNVVLSIEFERILSASGPYRGELVRPSDKKAPRRIAWIQCVGSRDVTSGNEYCSSVCCTYAIKQAVVAKEHVPFDLDTTIFFMDMRTYSKGFDEYYDRAKDEHKVRFIRSKVYSIEEVDGTGDLSLRYAAEDGKSTKEEFDLVVLSVGLQPCQEAADLAEKCGIRLNKYGFCQTSEFSLVETSRPGVFVCGAFQSPKDIPETVVQGTAAAACSSALLSPARHTLTVEKEYPPEKDVTGEQARIGVFICHCGINIGGVVNVPQVREYAATLPNVVFADESLYTCSQDTQEIIKEKIKEHNLNRVVVASCSPRTHEPLFQETIREAGLNRFLFEMANIRDQCSWVHMHEPEKATEKAKKLVRMAVARVALLQPLHKVTLGLSHEALVIGAGIAGMTAALSLAEQGFKTYLVEREKDLGGWVRKVYIPTNDQRPQDLLQSLIGRVKANQLIEVLADTAVIKTEGFVGNFKTTLASEGGQKQRLVEHGVIIVATGASEYRGTEFLLGENERVLTLSDLEQKLADSPEEVAQARDIAMILCVKPAEWDISYCSRVCCTVAIKNARKIKELNPEANIYILYKDIRTYGFKEELYTKARDDGIVFIRYSDERQPRFRPANGKVEVDMFEPIIGEEIIISPDLLVLATPMAPSEGNQELSRILKVPLTKEGFFHEAHVKLAPVDFASEGIFMCGTAHSPKFMDEAIAQAQAAAGRAATILAKKQLEVGGFIAQVDRDKCKACLTCVRVCPYGVPYINREGVAEIEVAECRGCGICAAECPRRAITLLHYREEQVVAKSEALLTAVG